MPDVRDLTSLEAVVRRYGYMLHVHAPSVALDYYLHRAHHRYDFTPHDHASTLDPMLGPEIYHPFFESVSVKAAFAWEFWS